MKKYLVFFVLFTISLWGYENSHLPPSHEVGRPAPPYMGKDGVRKGPGDNIFKRKRIDIENLLQEVRKISPYTAEKIEVLSKRNPRLGRVLTNSLNRAYFWYQKLKDDKNGSKYADEFWKLSVLEKEIALKIRNSTDKSEIKRLKKSLNKIVSKLFDFRQKAREIKIKRIEENLKRVKKELKQRAEGKRQIVKEHIDTLLGNKRHLSW